MSIIESLLIFFAIIAVYAITVYVLYKKGVLKKHNISFYGPALMWRTERGIQFLKNRARHERTWKAYGNASIVFCFVTMVLMTALIIWTAWIVFGFTPAQRNALPGPEVALVLPGINPILPLEYLGYILLGLVIAIVVHEFSHGILTLVDKLKVKSLGVLYLIVPIGAFCEPDDEEMKKAKLLPRTRIYAAGPTANFVVVLICILLFSFVFMPAVQPAAPGAVVFMVDNDSPAESIGLQPGMIITSVNGSVLHNGTEYFYALNQTRANQSIAITFMKNSVSYTTRVTLGDKYLELAKRPKEYVNNVSYKGKGYLGVQSLLRDSVFKEYLGILKNPFAGFPQSLLTFYSLPLLGYFAGFNPIAAPFTDSYVITGPLGVLPTWMFWMCISALYWVFWLNLAVSLFNVLPMVPLDGGFLFNDGIRALINKLKKGVNEDFKEKIVKNVSLVVSLLILALILLPFVMKYV
ncbi:MAG TPA: site-2 protease family protein [Candidatus Thermoplasmatota archaeon]|nr:site-2 protease family protein [Candidatus Thermoplasmatota archaeon]